MNIATLTTDMLQSPQGDDHTRFKLGMDGKQLIDFSASNDKIRIMASEAEAIKEKHGARALRNRITRDFSKAGQAMLSCNDSDPLLKIIVLARVADGMPVIAADRPLN